MELLSTEGEDLGMRLNHLVVSLIPVFAVDKINGTMHVACYTHRTTTAVKSSTAHKVHIMAPDVHV